MFKKIEIVRCPNCRDSTPNLTIKMCNKCKIPVEIIKIKRLFVEKTLNYLNEIQFMIIHNGEVVGLFDNRLRAYYIMLGIAINRNIKNKK